MAVMDNFKGSKKPKFMDEGPPTGDDARGGGGSDPSSEDDGMDYPDGAAGADTGGYDDAEDMASDDLADLAGVSPEDRDDWKNALKAYVSACVTKIMSEGDSGGTSDDTSEEG